MKHKMAVLGILHDMTVLRRGLCGDFCFRGGHGKTAGTLKRVTGRGVAKCHGARCKGMFPPTEVSTHLTSDAGACDVMMSHTGDESEAQREDAYAAHAVTIYICTVKSSGTLEHTLCLNFSPFSTFPLAVSEWKHLLI